MLVSQSGQHSPRGMTLFAGSIEVLAQHRVDGDFRAAPRQVVAYCGVRHLKLILVNQPGQHSPCGVTLLAGGIQVLMQHRVDKRPNRVQRHQRKTPRFRQRRGRGGQRQRLPGRPSM
jgi:hypothetical protein